MSSIITTPRPRVSQGSVDFDFTPHGSAVNYTIGGTVYVASGFFEAPLGSEITFTASAQLPTGRSAIEYLWDFGDGTEGWGSSVAHTFSVANPHLRVALTITDERANRYHIAKQMYLIDLATISIQPVIIVDP